MNNSEQTDAKTYLKDITKELQRLKQDLIPQLTKEIEELQTKKNGLLVEIDELKDNRDIYLTQQQELANKIAPAIAQELQRIVIQQLSQQGLNNDKASLNALNSYNSQADRIIASLDATIRNIFQTLQHDLTSYQSSMSQKLEQMYTLEQQGEAILDALVCRIKEELDTDNFIKELPPSPSASINYFPPPLDYNLIPEEKSENISLNKDFNNNKEEIIVQKNNSFGTNKSPNSLLGFGLILFSSIALYLQNIIIFIIFKRTPLFGILEIGGYLTPRFGNSLLMVFLRLVSFVPILVIMTGVLFPKIGADLKKAFKDKILIVLISICAFLLFISLVLMYFSLGYLNPGVAITFFFIFPIITVIFSWLFSSKKPSLLIFIAIATILFGLALMVFQDSDKLSTTRVIYVTCSGVAFAFHLLFIQLCTKRIDPIPFSLINFCGILIFSILSLFIPLAPSWSLSVEPHMWNNIIISGIMLGILSILSYLANNVGINLIGANRAAIFSSIGPLLTSILVWIIIGKSLIGLQILAMIIVTIGVTVLNLERLFRN